MNGLYANFVPKESLIFSLGIVNPDVRAHLEHIGGSCCPTSFRGNFNGVFIMISQINIAELKDLRGSNVLTPLFKPKDILKLIKNAELAEIFQGVFINFMTIPYDLRSFLIQFYPESVFPDNWIVEEYTFSLRLIADFKSSGSPVAYK